MAAELNFVRLLKVKSKRKLSFLEGTTVSVNLDKVRACLSAVRKWKVKRPLGGAGKWEYEVGEDLSPKRPDSEGLTESIANVS